MEHCYFVMFPNFFLNIYIYFLTSIFSPPRHPLHPCTPLPPLHPLPSTLSPSLSLAQCVFFPLCGQAQRSRYPWTTGCHGDGSLCPRSPTFPNCSPSRFGKSFPWPSMIQCQVSSPNDSSSFHPQMGYFFYTDKRVIRQFLIC